MIEVHGSVSMLMLLNVSPNILVVDVPSAELIAQHLHSVEHISTGKTIFSTLVFTYVTRQHSASISRMNNRAGMALYRAIVIGFHLCQSSASGERRSVTAWLSVP